jgi:type II secretory pathway pseudopilin PulG
MTINNKSFGYTLLEILLVLVLLTAASYTLLIRLPHSIPDRNLAIAANGLLDDLRETQQAAIASNTWHKVKFFPYANQYKIYKESKLIRSVDLPPHVRLDNSPPDLTFLPTGAPSIGVTVMLAAGNSKKNVIVAPVMGRIRLEDVAS